MEIIYFKTDTLYFAVFGKFTIIMSSDPLSYGGTCQTHGGVVSEGKRIKHYMLPYECKTVIKNTIKTINSF